ncbi:Importin N-terminal domain-containing protein [Meloidogyne graminicola]|uniref:Importin N-terminal domain-containing protein n=1 Tax=Meloidogyne graminicola TaxID=189291 RepID=A0A8S9ZW14_9BILA|nr:Importin N-terminal domain-containing protein [Meloidogyne graminicola]
MEINHIIEALKSTTIPDGQSGASEYLKTVSSLICFPQVLLQIIRNESLDCAVRQAAVIYMKNLFYEHWFVEKDKTNNQWEVSEQDKIFIRQHIIETIISAPEPIKIHLCIMIQNILRHDFPNRWPSFTVELHHFLGSDKSEELHGALLILHRLCKIFEYKRQKERVPLVDFMSKILPLIRERLSTLIENQTSSSCLLQKQILKIFYSFVQFSLNTQILSMPEFSQWLKLFIDIILKPTPVECEAVPIDEREGTIWWKCKKWSMKIIQRVFERYGNKGNVDKAYLLFAEEYSRSYLLPIVDSLLATVLNDYINGKFISDYVLYLVLIHLSDALIQSQVWLIIKPKFELLLKNVIFPLLQYTQEDEDLWSDDCEEFLRYKYDVYEDLHQPSSGASTLLQIISKRQGIMQQILEFILQNLTPTSSVKQVDGALHMISVISTQLNKSNDYLINRFQKYKKDVEKLIDAHVTPRIGHESRFVRLRACYVIHFASDTLFKNMIILERVVNTLIKSIKEDHEVPVKVEAALALQSLLNDQDQRGGVVQFVRPHIRDVLIILLRLVAETHLDDLPTIVDTLVENFEEEIIPVSYEITVELVDIFNKMVKSSDSNDDQIYEDHSVGAMGILTTLETILGLLEDHPEIISKVEPIVRNCIITIFDCYCENFFEEALSLVHTLIAVRISPEMWQVFDLVFKAFNEEGTTFFADCMPVLHSFLTVGTETFMASQERIQMLLSMCEKTVCDNECDELGKAHAAKMLEVFVLQSQGHVNSCLAHIIRLVLTQLQNPIKEENSIDQYRPQLLMVSKFVLVAAFYSDSNLCTNLFEHTQMDTQKTTFDWFLNGLYENRHNFEGIHDRKMLIWFLCRLLSSGQVPTMFHHESTKIIVWLLDLFKSLQNCIKSLADRIKEDSDDDDEESNDEDHERTNAELKDSDDDIDEHNMEYLEAIESENSFDKKRRRRNTVKSIGDQSVESDLFDEYETTSSITDDGYEEENDLEAYTTTIDDQDDKKGLNVFVLFKHTLEVLKQNSPELFNVLCNQEQLGEKRMAELKALTDVCIREEKLVESKHLAQSGEQQLKSFLGLAYDKFSSGVLVI